MQGADTGYRYRVQIEGADTQRSAERSSHDACSQTNGKNGGPRLMTDGGVGQEGNLGCSTVTPPGRWPHMEGRLKMQIFRLWAKGSV